ncbi:venom serine protease 34-like [Agrilus planipennis]|uniref:Venom serine protease 34-like n=1 Tax=Agrilus planipennis TaxID=224129 RepID=A0A7F5RK03_AGRPL|nr:venom serine protease 34-like [Agrilus planipennis]
MAIATSYNITQTSPLLSCDCGWHQRPRIVNGTNTGVNEFPAMAGLIDLLRRELTCGITIISKKYLVTAAHCFISDSEARHYAVLVGEDTEYSKLYQADKLKIHPKYNSNTKENDIAIVKTRQSIEFSFAVGPICLPFRYSFRTFVGANVIALGVRIVLALPPLFLDVDPVGSKLNGKPLGSRQACDCLSNDFKAPCKPHPKSSRFIAEPCTICGWGQLFFGGPKADILQKVNLTVVSNAFCQQEVTDNRIYSSEMCTYSLYKDSCMGDSGGPILWYDDTMLSSQRLFLLGVISFGSACANEIPAVNTRITSYLAWIVSETSDADYCIR